MQEMEGVFLVALLLKKEGSKLLHKIILQAGGAPNGQGPMFLEPAIATPLVYTMYICIYVLFFL